MIETFSPTGSLIANGINYYFGKDFYYFSGYADFKNINISQTDIVNLEFGINNNSYDNYKSKTINGKYAVINNFNPINAKPSDNWNWRKKLEVAQKNGAKAVFFVTNNIDRQIEAYEHYLTSATMKLKDAEVSVKNSFIPFYFISNKMGQSILNSKENITTNIKSKTKELTSSNVLGLIEGSDPILKDELIIITAHYDHIGVKGQEVYNGADDDGSGTVALLELAQAFQLAKNEGNGPRRSVLIMPVSGEEKGLLGSSYYASNPVYPLEKTITNLNIDMIGRIDSAHIGDTNYVYLIGSDKLSTDLHKISEGVNKTYNNLKLDYRYNKKDDPNRFYYRSDHYNFAKNGVPVIFYFNGVHEDYHQITDTYDKINFDKIENITRLVFYTAWELANRDNKPRVDK